MDLVALVGSAVALRALDQKDISHENVKRLILCIAAKARDGVSSDRRSGVVQAWDILQVYY